MKLDAKDEALLLALERNARAPVVELARRIGLSRSATQDRLARLERNGVIRAYTIERGSSSSDARILAWLMITLEGDCSHARNALNRVPQLRAVYALAGKPDVLVQVEVSSADELNEIAMAVRSAPTISDVTTHVVLVTPFKRQSQQPSCWGLKSF